MNILVKKLIAIILVAFISWSGSPAGDAAAGAKPDWKEQYAYTLGMQAYVFGFPYVYLLTLRWNWVTQPKPADSITPYAPLNHFYNVRNLATPAYRDGGSPNNNTSIPSHGLM